MSRSIKEEPVDDVSSPVSNSTAGSKGTADKRHVIDLGWQQTYPKLLNSEPPFNIEVVVTSRKLKAGESPSDYLFRTHQYEFMLIPDDRFFEWAGRRAGFRVELKLLKKHSERNEYQEFTECGMPVISYSCTEFVFMRRWAVNLIWPDEKNRILFKGDFCFVVNVFRKVDKDTLRRIVTQVSTPFKILSKPMVYLKNKADKAKNNNKKRGSASTSSSSSMKKSKTEDCDDNGNNNDNNAPIIIMSQQNSQDVAFEAAPVAATLAATECASVSRTTATMTTAATTPKTKAPAINTTAPTPTAATPTQSTPTSATGRRRGGLRNQFFDEAAAAAAAAAQQQQQQQNANTVAQTTTPVIKQEPMLSDIVDITGDITSSNNVGALTASQLQLVNALPSLSPSDLEILVKMDQQAIDMTIDPKDVSGSVLNTSTSRTTINDHQSSSSSSVPNINTDIYIIDGDFVSLQSQSQQQSAVATTTTTTTTTPRNSNNNNNNINSNNVPPGFGGASQGSESQRKRGQLLSLTFSSQDFSFASLGGSQGSITASFGGGASAGGLLAASQLNISSSNLFGQLEGGSFNASSLMLDADNNDSAFLTKMAWHENLSQSQ